jgi:hypothetical protein
MIMNSVTGSKNIRRFYFQFHEKSRPLHPDSYRRL